jgi:hypothetical protein
LGESEIDRRFESKNKKGEGGDASVSVQRRNLIDHGRNLADVCVGCLFLQDKDRTSSAHSIRHKRQKPAL